MDSSWFTWFEIEHRMVTAWRQGNYAAAMAEIDAVLSYPFHPEICSGALAYRAVIKAEMGKPIDAKEGYLRAHSLSRPLGHPRFGHEMGLGYLCERQGSVEEALFWFRTALLTARDARRMSAGSALRRFLRLRGESNLTVEERTLCLTVARQSWEFLQLPGDPDTTNLEKAAGAIIEGESRSRKERQS